MVELDMIKCYLELLTKPGLNMVDLWHDQTACQRRTVGRRCPATTSRTTQAQGWPTPGAGPRRLDRHHLRAEERHPLGAAAAGAGLRLWRDLLAPIAGLAGGRRLGRVAPHVTRSPRRSRSPRLEPGVSGQCQYPRQKGGEAVGPNPKDRGKTQRVPRTKRHGVVERGGIPLAALLSGANRHDSMVFEPLLDAIPPITQPNRRRRRRPNKVHADQGYDYPRCRSALSQRHIKVRIARKGIDSSQHLGRHRWVVERTLAWRNHVRRLRGRDERRVDIHHAFLTLGCCLLCFNTLQQRF
jgi:transposase